MTVTVAKAVVEPDDGLAVFTQPIDLEVLREKTDALIVIPAPASTSHADNIREMYLQARAHVLSAARSARATARDAAAWMYTGARDGAAATGRWWRRYRYGGEHRVQSHWFGRERSTAEQTGYRHRTFQLETAARRALTSPPAPEGELPGRPTESVYWVGWLERIMEIMRAEDEALHPRTGHRFICS